MNPDLLSNLDSPPPEESSNRTFLAAAGILGGIILLSLACLAAYAVLVLPSQRAGMHQAIAVQAVQIPGVAQAITAAAAVLGLPTPTGAPLPTQTPFIVQPIASGGSASLVAPTATTFPPTRTPFIAPPTSANTSLADPFTATVAAALTRASDVQLTNGPTSTALPETGIADAYGAPGLVVAAIALIAVIFIARRLRSAQGGSSGQP